MTSDKQTNQNGASVQAAARDSKLRRYCATGIGTTVLVGAVTTMDASVVYTNFNNTVLTDTTVGDSLPTDYEVYLAANGTFNVSSTNTGTGTQIANFFIDTESSGATTNFAVVTAGVNSGTTHALNVIGITVAGASSHVYNYPSRLAAGVSVGPGGKFVTLSGTQASLVGGSLAFGAGFTNSKWAKTGKNSGYLGIDFLGTDGLTHYAFLDFTVATNTSTTPGPRSITLISGGYQTTAATAITTAALPSVPEPSALALLAAGGLGGVAAFRRRRNAAAAAKAAVVS